MHEIVPITWPKINGKYYPLDPIYLVIQFSERINQNKNWCNETVRISRRPHSAGVKPTMHGSHVQHRSVGSHSFIMSVGSEKSGLIWGMHINYEIAPEKYQRGEEKSPKRRDPYSVFESGRYTCIHRI